ncbi:MAG: DivIVA domain-containing protein [Candidatus Neomarinimicrobiota bacterium]
MIKTSDIRDRRFKKVMRGYDPVEVKFFLEMLAEEFSQMEEKIEKMELLTGEFDKTHKGRDKIIKEAQERATRIILDAESISAGVVETAQYKKELIEESITKLNFAREKLIQRLRDALKTQTELIVMLENDGEDWSDEQPDV